jgi:hypothetical protein
MKYIGTDPREGAKVIASSDISSATSTVTFDDIFDTNSMYFMEVAHYLSSNDIGGTNYTWRASGGSDNGDTNRSTQYVSANSTRYGASDSNTLDQYGYNSFAGNHSGDVSAYETGSVSSFFVPNTTNEKYYWGEAIGWNPTTEMLSLQMNTSYSDATAMDGIMLGDTINTINRMKTRIYKYPEHKPSVLSLKQTLPTVSYVEPKYIGQINSGKGLSHVATYTASGGESSIDFTDIFSNKYDRYYFYLTSCRPATDDTNLQAFWIQTDGTVESTTTDYYKGYRYMDSNGTSATGFNNNQNNPNLMYNVGTDNDECGHLYMWCDNPNPESSALGKALRFRSIHQRSSVTGRNEMTRFMTGVLLFDETTIMGGIRFAWSSGNWETGRISIYGLEL